MILQFLFRPWLSRFKFAAILAAAFVFYKFGWLAWVTFLLAVATFNTFFERRLLQKPTEGSSDE